MHRPLEVLKVIPIHIPTSTTTAAQDWVETGVPVLGEGYPRNRSPLQLKIKKLLLQSPRNNNFLSKNIQIIQVNLHCNPLNL